MPLQTPVFRPRRFNNYRSYGSLILKVFSNNNKNTWFLGRCSQYIGWNKRINTRDEPCHTVARFSPNLSHERRLQLRKNSRIKGSSGPCISRTCSEAPTLGSGDRPSSMRLNVESMRVHERGRWAVVRDSSAKRGPMTRRVSIRSGWRRARSLKLHFEAPMSLSVRRFVFPATILCSQWSRSASVLQF